MASEFAKQIASDFFTDGTDGKADRLVLAKTTEMPGRTGWSEMPFADRLDSHLKDIRKLLTAACGLICKGCGASLPLETYKQSLSPFHKPTTEQKKAGYVRQRCSAFNGRKLLALMEVK